MSTHTASQASVPSAVKLNASTTSYVQKGRRIQALDFTKGTLVLLMVLYHWINYFIGPQWAYYQYLRFLTPSFIFITGFMISNVYLSKYAATDTLLTKRLFTRGIKLLAVFVFLNAARTVTVPLLGTGALVQSPLSTGNLFTVFASGNLPATGAKLVAFSILVPISYLLVLSGALMLPYRLNRYTFHFVCVILLVSIAILGVFGKRSFNLEFIAIGMLGVLIGFLPITMINDFARHPYAVVSAYVCYTVAITIWNVPFPLVVVGVLLSLIVIYLVGAGGRESGAIKNEFILLGKYSLLGYISQIAILQVLSASLHRINYGVGSLVLSFLAAFVLTVLSVEIMDRARAKITGVDRLYKGIFA